MKTETLIIDQLSLTDHSFIRALVNSSGWLEFIGDRNVTSDELATDYIHRILNHPTTRYWVVKLASNNVPIGIITLLKRDYLEFHDIGFAFLPEYAKQGFAYEASKKIMNDLFPESSILYAITIPENIKSIGLLKKLGFEFEKEIIANKETLNVFKLTT
ncbi:MAG: GNAT family N-acetyltransferase [Cyclobacteriaceae bacterium]|nr:GNAT family N-acetyltransferase [Cyclobacteriaceae bacterium]